MNRIFISYNPSELEEQNLAIRLQTIGSLYGLHISLPDRIGTTTLKTTTKQRIQESTFFIVFSTKSLSKPIRDEISFARSIHKQIIVIYDKDVPRNLNLNDVHEIEFNKSTDTPEKVIKEILKVIKRGQTKKQAQEVDSFSAFVLIGLGLLLLIALTGSKK